MRPQGNLYRRYLRVVKKCPRFILIAGLTMSTMGVSCDGEAASVFRQTATSPIGEGLKTILYGLVDGMVAAVKSVGEGKS